MGAIVVFTIAFVKAEIALYILIFSMLLSPEILIGEAGGRAALGRGVTLRFDDFLLAFIGFGWFAKTAVYKELGLFLRTPLNKPIFYYLLACVVSTGFGAMAGRVEVKTGFFFVLKYFEYFIVYFMVVNYIENKEQIKKYIFCIFLTCLIISLYGMLQIPGGERVSAPFEGEIGEPNTLGGYLIFIGAIAAGIFSKAESTRTKFLLGALIVVILIPFLYTESRASYLAFIPTYFILAILNNKKGLMIGLLIVGLVLSPFFLPSKVQERILFTFKQESQIGQLTIGGVRVDTSTSARLTSWKEGLKDWPRHPILGYGVTGYAFMDAQFLKVLVETGSLGFIAFVYLLYSIFRMSLTNLRELKDSYFNGLTIGFLAGFIGLLFHSIGANTFIIVRIMEPFWLLTGIIVMLPALEQKEPSLSQKIS